MKENMNQNRFKNKRSYLNIDFNRFLLSESLKFRAAESMKWILNWN